MIRLNKFLASAGIGSRRKCDEYIHNGRVRVNQEVVCEMGIKINELSDKVEFDGKLVEFRSEFIYIMLNKPKGIITSIHDEYDRKTIIDLIPIEERIFPVGRLDQDTTGLILLTNDGDLTNKLIHPKYKLPKTYRVLLDKVLRPKDAYHFERGIQLEEKKTAPCKLSEIRIIDNCSFVEVIITEGLNRQIRRMFDALGYEVDELDRIGFGPLTLSGLKRSEWRYLSDSEVNLLKSEGE